MYTMMSPRDFKTKRREPKRFLLAAPKSRSSKQEPRIPRAEKICGGFYFVCDHGKHRNANGTVC